MRSRTPQEVPPRHWYLDALAAGAFFLQAIVLARLLRGIPFAALFVFAFSAGIGWVYARAAWRGLVIGRK